MAIKVAKFPKDTMFRVLRGEEGRKISDEIVDTGRWSIFHEMIFELNGETYSVGYSVGATESQDERPWQYERDEIECVVVRPVEKTVVVYVEVEDETSSDIGADESVEDDGLDLSSAIGAIVEEEVD